jgi:hypothetical protein
MFKLYIEIDCCFGTMDRMSPEEPLIGKVSDWVRIDRFRVPATECKYGPNGFKGFVPYEFWPSNNGVDGLAGWACGLFALYNAMNLMTQGQVDLKEVVNVGRGYGANEGEGVGEWTMEQTAIHFGFGAEVMVLPNTLTLLNYLKKGDVFIGNIWEQSHDEIPDSSQRGDGHWVVVAGADEQGGLVLIDSSLRGAGGWSRPTYGVWQVTARGYRIMAQDSADARFNGSETVVLPDAVWGFMFGLRMKSRG